MKLTSTKQKRADSRANGKNSGPVLTQTDHWKLLDAMTGLAADDVHHIECPACHHTILVRTPKRVNF